jgi:PAS domain S-box-containing protein
MPQTPTLEDLESENQQLRARLESAEETLRAIRSFEVDALIVGLSGTERVFALGSADETYRTFVEVMPHGAVTVSRDGAILYCNRHFAELVRSPLERTIGESIYTFATPEDEGLLRALIWEGLSCPMVKQQFSLRAVDGVHVPAALLATPLAVEGMTHVCVLVTDLTEHEARLAAEAANAAKDRFLALLSHELRTPLTPALLAVGEMEANTALPPAVREGLAMIRRGIELETRLIEDLLDRSRVISGKLSLRRQQVNLHSLLQNVVATVDPDLREKKLRLHCELSAAAIILNADPTRLQQVFWNLLKNAVKFSSEGGPITIRCRDAASGFVSVDIEDEGAGIDADDLPRVFDAFEQGQSGSRQLSSGLGLGLTIAKAVVEAHGGKISAGSEGRGHGARFVVTLPVATTEAEIRATAPQKLRPSNTAPLRVLLVEDDRDTAVTLSKLLRFSGHQSEIAGDVASALALASAQPFDLVISDIALPDGTGYQLMQQIRENYGIPGIALTGYGMDSDLRASDEAGFAEHLIKPINIERLHEVIARVASSVEEARNAIGSGGTDSAHGPMHSVPS